MLGPREPRKGAKVTDQIQMGGSLWMEELDVGPGKARCAGGGRIDASHQELSRMEGPGPAHLLYSARRCPARMSNLSGTIRRNSPSRPRHKRGGH